MANLGVLSKSSSYRVQKTLQESIKLKGIGLHSGAEASLRLVPAPANQGIIFERKDLSKPCRIFAHYDAVVATELATTLGYSDWEEARIGTVEHLLSALFGLGITNLKIEIHGPEIPILDGSATDFVESILACGIEIQPYSTATLKILKPIKIYQDGAICELLPRDNLRIMASIDFPHPFIGLQTFAVDLTPKSFRSELCSARTFGFVKDLERLQKAKLAQGASLENVLAFTEEDVLNPGGVRFSDECVRHKLLDALGDLALCGSWIEGELVSYRGGHKIHLALLKSLRNFPSHWKLIPSERLRLQADASQAWEWV